MGCRTARYLTQDNKTVFMNTCPRESSAGCKDCTTGKGDHGNSKEAAAAAAVKPRHHHPELKGGGRLLQ